MQNPLNNKYRELIYRTGDIVKYNERGELLYVGRKDNQIKHNGYRIELGEIENICLTLPGIIESCCTYNKEKKMICLFYTTNNNTSEQRVYSYLKEKIPRYMLPDKIKVLEIMPINQNGKLDRKYIKQELT